MVKYIMFPVVLIYSCIAVGEVVNVDGSNVEYKVRTSEYNSSFNKLNLEIEVKLIDGRLPKKEELQAVSDIVLKGQPKAERRWVFFYLPKMESGAGAYATDHRIPQHDGLHEELTTMEYMLSNTPYQHLVK